VLFSVDNRSSGIQPLWGLANTGLHQLRVGALQSDSRLPLDGAVCSAPWFWATTKNIARHVVAANAAAFLVSCLFRRRMENVQRRLRPRAWIAFIGWFLDTPPHSRRISMFRAFGRPHGFSSYEHHCVTVPATLPLNSCWTNTSSARQRVLVTRESDTFAYHSAPIKQVPRHDWRQQLRAGHASSGTVETHRPETQL